MQVWPTGRPPGEGKEPPKPQRELESIGSEAEQVVTSPTGLAAFARTDGGVVLRTLDGHAPRLGALPGEGAVRVAFSADARTLLALRSGRLFEWTLR